jgi:hypothetical protein
MQKAVRTKENEDQAKQQARDCRSDFHGALLSPLDRAVLYHRLRS